MKRRREIKPQSVPVHSVCHRTGSIEVRRFEASRDSFVALTALLRRAVAPLGARGLDCTCVDQTIATTREHALGGACYVAVSEGRVVGTL